MFSAIHGIKNQDYFWGWIVYFIIVPKILTDFVIFFKAMSFDYAEKKIFRL